MARMQYYLLLTSFVHNARGMGSWLKWDDRNLERNVGVQVQPEGYECRSSSEHTNEAMPKRTSALLSRKCCIQNLEHLWHHSTRGRVELGSRLESMV